MKLCVTGSGGLIGGEVSAYFAAKKHSVYGLDNNMRADFFGSRGDISWRQKQLKEKFPSFIPVGLDIRDRAATLKFMETLRPDVVVHCAAQPSHDLAASRPFDDFDVNAVGTLNMLESVRRYAPEAVFVHMSTNKVYGDAPNELKLKELPSRWEYDDPAYSNGIAEDFRIDRSKHSIFGASKVAGDIMVQEYGRYFGIRSCCLRGGCLTGPNHSGVELHGFLSYLIRVNVTGGVYKVFGYKGKQVRDNIHSLDVAAFIERFIDKPRVAEIYNLGGGRGNSCSILEAFDMVSGITGKKMNYEYVEKNREGDHICYISDLRKIRAHYPGWDITLPLEKIFGEIAQAWKTRL
jgi:CDP-paratose 2-epimerase